MGGRRVSTVGAGPNPKSERGVPLGQEVYPAFVVETTLERRHEVTSQVP